MQPPRKILRNRVKSPLFRLQTAFVREDHFKPDEEENEDELEEAVGAKSGEGSQQQNGQNPAVKTKNKKKKIPLRQRIMQFFQRLKPKKNFKADVLKFKKEFIKNQRS